MKREIGVIHRNVPDRKLGFGGVLNQFLAWIRVGIGIGLMLFSASITLSFLNHGSNWMKDSAKQSQLRVSGRGYGPVQPSVANVEPVRVARSQISVPKSDADYRMFREQTRFVTDLSNTLSRTVSRFAR